MGGARTVGAMVLVMVVGACGDETPEETPSTGGGGVTSSTTDATSSSAGGGGHGGAGTGGNAATGGGGGSEEGFPWEGAIDPNGGPASSRLTSHEVGTTASSQGYWAYEPAGYPGSVQWPLLIALHGVGENGNGGTQLGDVLDAGIPKLIDKDNWPNERPFVVLMPQHSGGGCPSANEVETFISFALTTYDIDPRYVYLTGLSCGAIGSWSYLNQHLDSQIAAMVPIAGNGTGAWNNRGCELGKVAIWAFHGDADGTVPVSGTNTPMDGLAGCPAPPALENEKTIYPDVGHNSWDRTYDLSAGHDIYTWMLGFTRDP